jgi:predicted AAA+ superfamily ATPase
VEICEVGQAADFSARTRRRAAVRHEAAFVIGECDGLPGSAAPPAWPVFLPVAALFHAQALNASSLARDAGVARSTVQGYVQILDDTLLTFQVPAYEARLRVRERRHPKPYWVDPGLVRAVAGDTGPPDASTVGPPFEGGIAQCLRAYNDYNGLYDEMRYWAPEEALRAQVDFLLRRGHRFTAIEVVATRRWRPDLAKGLRAIADLGRIDRRIVVYMGAQTLRPEAGSEVLPLAKFLDEVRGGL